MPTILNPQITEFKPLKNLYEYDNIIVYSIQNGRSTMLLLLCWYDLLYVLVDGAEHPWRTDSAGHIPAQFLIEGQCVYQGYC